MNPWELIPWAISIAISLCIVMLPLAGIVALVTLARGLK